VVAGAAGRVRPVRILVVEPDLHDSGAIRSGLELAEAWLATGHDVRVAPVSPVAPAATVPVPAGVTVLAPAVPGARLRRRLPVTVARLVPEARRADVVLSGREVDWGLLVAAAVARLARRPLAVAVRADPERAIAGHAPPRLAGATRRALGAADLALCVSHGLGAAVRALARPPRRVVVLDHGVHVGAVRAAAQAPPPTGTVAADPAAEPVPVVAAVGRLAPQKGFDLLVRAHADVLAAGVPHRVVVLGDGPERERLAALAARLGVADTVALPGFVANPHAAVARAAVLTAPSRWEGYGRTLAEAVALGVPVIAADCPHGPREVLGDGRFGRLVPVEDAAALAGALAAHLRDPADLRERAAAGAAAAPARFDPVREAAQALAALADLR